MAESPYLTVEEAMAYLKVKTRSNLYNLVTRRHLPCLRRGKVYLFDRRELDAWLRGTTALELSRQRRSA